MVAAWRLEATSCPTARIGLVDSTGAASVSASRAPVGSTIAPDFLSTTAYLISVL
jgi:hypothetical protein